jgi:hypothetical protein
VTFEKKCFVTPEDIKAVQFTCMGCGTYVVVPVGKIIDTVDIGTHIVRTCQCGLESNFGIGTQETENLIHFNKLLASLPATLKGRNISFAFQIECSE